MIKYRKSTFITSSYGAKNGFKGYIKKGLVTEAAKSYIGKLVNVDIGIVLV